MSQYLLSTYAVEGEVPGAPEYARGDADVHGAGHCPRSRDGGERHVRLRRRAPWPRRGDRRPHRAMAMWS